jgi:hypothetical protein
MIIGKNAWAIVLPRDEGSRLNGLTVVESVTVPKRFCSPMAGHSHSVETLQRAASVVKPDNIWQHAGRFRSSSAVLCRRLDTGVPCSCCHGGRDAGRNPELSSAARKLDAKFGALAVRVTAA